MPALPRIAVTMGDPAGVGPEVCLHLLANEQILERCVPIVFGDADVLRRVAGAAKLPLNAPVIDAKDWASAHAQIDRPTLLDLQAIAAQGVQPGIITAATGRA